jgi:DNA (cytosine-5)-methyltransferase 1
MSIRSELTVASFFAGIGGFDLGFEQAGFDVVWQCEKKPFCNQILEKQWPGVPRGTDIEKVKPDDIRPAAVWTGGFPCQDVSLARMGPREGLRGKKSGLFFKFRELLEAQGEPGRSRPEVVVIENVTGLLSSHDGRDFAVVIRALADCGYGVAWRVLDSRYFGVPQSRKRVFIVGSLRGPAVAGSILFEPERCSRNPTARRPNGKKSVSPFQIIAGDSKRGFAKQLAHCLYAESARHTGTDWSRNYVSYPEGRVRRLTPVEAEQLQGFAPGYTVPEGADPTSEKLDSARYHACGNAVTVPVAAWIGQRVRWVLEECASIDAERDGSWREKAVAAPALVR